MTVLSDFAADTLTGGTTLLSEYEGKVVLVVNTASNCGFTPQYEALERLWETYRDRGLVVLGFPCNQFGRQEPGDAATISEFCQANYGVTFPLFAKVDVNGRDSHPLFDWLRTEATGALGTTKIKWNFTKFLVGRDGTVMKRFGSTTKPDRLTVYIERALGL